MAKAFGKMHVVGAGLVGGEEEEPASVDEPDEVHFESTEIGGEW